MEGGEESNFVTGLDLISDDRPVNNSELPHPSAPGYECGDFLDVIIDEKIVSKRSLKSRSDPEYRERERIKNLERTRKLRMDPAFRDKERIKNRISKQRARLDPCYREAERVRNRIQKRKAREDPAYREAERIRNMWQKRRAREDPMFRMKERIKDLERKRVKRWGYSQCDDEWMEIGAVKLDEEARVAFEHGLYRVVTNHEGNSWEESDVLIKSEPDSSLWDSYFDNEIDQSGNPEANINLYRNTLDESTNHQIFKNSGVWAHGEVVKSNNELDENGSDFVTKTTVLESAGETDLKKQIPSPLLTHALSTPPLSSQDTCSDKVGQEVNMLNDKNKLKINLNDIEILPLSQKREDKYPNYSEALRSNNESDENGSDFVTKNTFLEPGRETDLKKQIPSPILTHALSTPPLSSQDNYSDKVGREVNMLNDKNKLKINLNDIEILPLSQKREDKFPNLNWQIEVLRVDKVDKNDKDFKSFHTSSQTIDYNTKFAKQYPTIQV